MIEMNHINTKLSDYVLGLLPRQERRDVEQHVANCAECEAALAVEKMMGHMLRNTLHVAAQPGNGRLQQLMPVMPTQQRRWTFTWQRQLASLYVLLILVLGGMGWYESNRSNSIGPVPTFVAVTATYTSEPTTTETTETATAEPTVTAVSDNAAPSWHITPPPNPTPIAALSTFSN